MSISERPIIPFTQFVQSMHAARAEHFLNAPTSKIAHESAFNEMWAHLTNYYDSVTCAHTFVDANGSVFDCIPVEQQVSRRGQSGAIPTAPDLPVAVTQTAAPPPPAGQLLQLHPDLRDPLGNQMLAPDGTIPVRRMTIEDMSRFRTLRHYMEKSPGVGGGLRPPGASGDIAPQVAATHRWAHAFQNVGNLGGASYVNVWDPQIAANEIFSLAQHWYVGGSGSGLQTAEVGWQVYPGFYQNTQPCLFIYWTADDYQSTGCYNLTCSAFVQTNNNWALGGALSPWSVAGGAQYELFMAYYLVGGNWWLYLGGGAASNAVGYYPTSIYRGGAMASNASEIDYGGEVVGTTSWPPMGGGAYAAAGWQYAAYQRQIQYFPTGGGRTDASLTAAYNLPCYTSLVVNYAAPWNETVWFGGPGGTNC